MKNVNTISIKGTMSHLKLKMVLICLFYSFTRLGLAQFSFTASPESGCSPLTVAFTNTSTDTTGYYYYWEFNDGSPYMIDTQTTTLTHTFDSGGFYWVFFNVYDSLQNYIGFNYFPVEVFGNIRDFNISSDTVCPGEFVNMGINGPYSSVYWSFGDGYFGNGSYASHAYTDTGTFTITLVAISLLCGTNDTVQQEVHVLNNLAMPPFDMNISPDPVCPGDEVNIGDMQGIDNYSYYEWDYGDGNTFASENFWEGNRHSYSSIGNYQVILTVTNGCGNSYTDTGSISVQNNLQMSGYLYVGGEPNPACPGDLVFFYTNSGFQYYVWNFGDGGADTTYYGSTTHEYSTFGDYLITVMIENGCGNDTTVYDSVFIENTVPVTGDMNIFTNAPGCPNDMIQFYASTENEYSYSWDFGDGNYGTDQWITHAYSAAGTYTVSLTVTNSCGMDSVLTSTVQILNNLPVDINDYEFGTTADSACPGDSMIFYVWPNAGTFVWDFGDGNGGVPTGTIEGAAIVLHAYGAVGTYNAVITITNGCGNYTADSSTVVNIGNNAPAEFFIEAVTDPLCLNDPVELVVFGSGNNFNWYFGDGDSAQTTLPGVSHIYSAEGVYTIIMNGSNNCGNTGSDTIEVIIDDCTVGNGSPASVTGSDPVIFPNPSNGFISISFSLIEKSEVSLILYDIAGKRYQLIDGKQLEPGNQMLNVNLMEMTLSPGFYLVNILINGDPQFRKLIIY